MEIIIRSARIIDTGSPFHNQVKDIHLSGNRILKIADKIRHSGSLPEIKVPDLHVSLGWVDLNTFLADPGYEHKEDIGTGCSAAAQGGFTHICCMPNTMPIVQTKAQIQYILSKAASHLVDVHPLAALSENTEGKNLTEMYDLHRAGAIAFCDGPQPSPNAGLLERALWYVKAFNGLIMVHPEEKSISKNGVMHEGLTSTLLGLRGAPGLAEEMAVNRDLYLLEYTHSKLHFLNISLSKSAKLIREAKKKGLPVTASVNAYNLMWTDAVLDTYNTNFKVNPPLRTQADIAALAKALADGTIDTITSAHQPHEEDEKKLEFDKAAFGIIGLETCFAVANTVLKGKVDLSTIIAALANNPRKILGLHSKIEEGALADLTLFNPNYEWTFTEADIRSKSKNTPFIGTKFTGKVLAVINHALLHTTSEKLSTHE